MNWTKRLPQLMHIALLFALASCTSGVNPSPYPNTSYPNISTASPTPRALPTYPKYPTPIPPTPIQLPIIEGNPEIEACSNPVDIFLSISDAQGLTDDGIAEKLMSSYLNYFNSPQTPGYCRIDGYRIEEVYRDEKLESTVSPKGDFIRVVDFSIKLIQQYSRWMNYSGEIDQQNWLHTSNVLIIFKVEAEGVYTMRFPDP